MNLCKNWRERISVKPRPSATAERVSAETRGLGIRHSGQRLRPGVPRERHIAETTQALTDPDIDAAIGVCG